ncbi:hypothetical protein [Gilvimarinus sp. DA14]|uniref:hypothetical protein n=1 Tax=Gilvimarinus sp. DA14 TaxID=2956798 RepID=UPI0020B86BE1|nr:hypothetical protein [Gilvimarinus sp. DA14]UTF59614.1 hypothetical protein NHM04_14185 [Gilvimarinus sp. DA14]
MARFILLWFCVLSLTLTSPSSLAFELSSKGEVVWVADGDSFRFRPDNALMWVKLRKQALARDKNTTHSMRVDDRFVHEDMSFLVRVGNVDTAESNTARGIEAERFARAKLEGERALCTAGVSAITAGRFVHFGRMTGNMVGF